MSNVTVKGGSLEDQVLNLLNASEAVVRAASKDAAKKAANDTMKRLKRTSPKRKGNYAKGWKVTYQDGAYIVHNSKLPGYTQLLEKGHDVIVAGKKVGSAPAQPHIEPAEEAGIAEFVFLAEENIERRLNQ
jgi:hypothetical protein